MKIWAQIPSTIAGNHNPTSMIISGRSLRIAVAQSGCILTHPLI